MQEEEEEEEEEVTGGHSLAFAYVCVVLCLCGSRQNYAQLDR